MASTTFIFVTIVAAAILHLGSGLTCYICHSDGDTDCKNTTIADLSNCADVVPQPHPPNAGFYCLRYNAKSAGRVITTMECITRKDICEHREQIKEFQDYPNSVDISCEVCDTDACNIDKSPSGKSGIEAMKAVSVFSVMTVAIVLSKITGF